MLPTDFPMEPSFRLKAPLYLATGQSASFHVCAWIMGRTAVLWQTANCSMKSVKHSSLMMVSIFLTKSLLPFRHVTVIQMNLLINVFIYYLQCLRDVFSGTEMYVECLSC